MANDELKPDCQQSRAISNTWGSKIIEISNGWTCIPNILIENQKILEIDPVKMNIILVLLKYWLESENTSYPSKKVIADIIGRDVDTVRKHMKQMEELCLIKRVPRYFSKNKGGGQTSNEYDLQGLLDKLIKLEEKKYSLVS